MDDLDAFTTIPEAAAPASPTYVVEDPDRGDDMAGWSPPEALLAISRLRSAARIWCWAGNRHSWLSFASTSPRAPLPPG